MLRRKSWIFENRSGAYIEVCEQRIAEKPGFPPQHSSKCQQTLGSGDSSTILLLAKNISLIKFHTEQLSKTTYSWLRDYFLLAFGIAIIFGLFLGNRPLSVPDEARYSEIPREMVVSGNYITPHLDDIKYFEKPALFYWMQVVSIKSFGLNQWAVRLPNAFMALLGCLITYGTARSLYGRRTGLIASLLLATNLFYFTMAHAVTLDMAVSTLLSGSLFSFLIGVQNPSGYKRQFFCYGAYIFAAIAVLTKGLIGVIFPSMIIGVWLLLLNDWRLLKTIYLPTGILIFLLIALPWHILVQLKNPEFFHFYFIDQQFSRYLTLSAERYQPDWFFISILVLGLFPWAIFLFQAILYNLPTNWAERRKYKNALFLLLWAAFVFIFFSFSDSKLIPYILPMFPPLAIIIGRYIAASWDHPLQPPGVKWGYTILPGIFLLASISGLYITHRYAIPNLHKANLYLITIGTIWVLGAISSAWLCWRQHNTIAFSVLLLSTLIVLFIGLKSITTFDTRSIKHLAMILKPLLKPNDEVVAYEHYYQDLPFYIQRRVTIVDWQNELAFGMQHQDTHSWMINQQTFWQRWQSNNQVYMITDQDTYHTLQQTGQNHLYFLGETPTNVLVANHPP